MLNTMAAVAAKAVASRQHEDPQRQKRQAHGVLVMVLVLLPLEGVLAAAAGGGSPPLHRAAEADVSRRN